jgi:hypothetical protein
MGEPLLNPDIYRFIEHAAPYAMTSFATNGSAVTEANVRKLIAAGLHRIYFSFNGEQAAVFQVMMGGLSFDKVLTNLRTAVRLSKGTSLSVEANVSITKANQDHVSRITKLLQDEGVREITYSLCHSRGGNLDNPAVCDTPPMPGATGSCDVLKNTLFVDWRGKVFICDHDIHGDHTLGDLMTEPLDAILTRRERLLEAGLSFKICQDCNDIMRIGDSPVLGSGAGGIFRDWMFNLYADAPEPLSHATPAFKWIFHIYEKEQRLDRLVNHLLWVEKCLQAELETVRRSPTYRIIQALKSFRSVLSKSADLVRPIKVKQK